MKKNTNINGNIVTQHLGTIFGRTGLITATDLGLVYVEQLGAKPIKVASKKEDVDLKKWIEDKRKYHDELPKWKKVKKIPSMATVKKWVNDQEHCKSTLGKIVEPDGYDPDGAPSWLLFFGLI